LHFPYVVNRRAAVALIAQASSSIESVRPYSQAYCRETKRHGHRAGDPPKTIVEARGGRIWTGRNAIRGVTFGISLPIGALHQGVAGTVAPEWVH
jgi:hypothetical protein